MQGKTPVFPVETSNNFSVSFQVSVPFKYGIGIQPISLTSTEPAAGSIAVVSGWGELYVGGPFSSQLQAVNVFVISRPECDYYYADYDGINVNTICAGVPGGGNGFCGGDLGSPLVVGDQLVGIVSWGVGCAEAQHPGLYSNVATLKNFVIEQTGVQ